MIPTRTLKFWGFKEHPFADNILRDDLLKLFVDRKDEIADVEDALGHSRIIGVYGSLGVGKSSFLQKLKQELRNEKHPVAYVHLTADSEETLYRELLAELLVLLDLKILKLKKKSVINSKAEAERLCASVSTCRGANFGAKLLGILGGDFKEDKTKHIPIHDEASARGIICKIFDNLTTPLVVIFDDFEKLKYESQGKIRDYFPILSRFIATLEELFNHKEVSFVVSMDNHVEKHLHKHREDGGEFAFALNSLCKLPNFKIEHLHDFIKIRLKKYGWKKGVYKFLTKEAFLALTLASANHPRRAVRILAEALKEVAKTKEQSEKQINFDKLCSAALRTENPLDEKDWIVLSYLRDHGQASANDDGLREALDFKKSKRKDGYHTSVDRRLRAIAKSLRIEFDEEPTGNTRKKVLRFPDIPKD